MKPTGSGATVRDATYALMRAFGMTKVFGNPGSTELPMFRDFPEDFEYVLGLQESVAVGMADGYAQATRNAALVNLHSSAGVGHALGAIFTAYRNQTPLVVTAGQQARSILPYEPLLFAQDATEFPKPFVKWAIEPARAEDVPAALARAYYVAMQHPQGPVFVSVPVDDWDRACEPIETRRIGTTLRGDPEVLAEAAKALSAARNPALVVGAGVSRDQAWDEIIQLAELHQARVLAPLVSPRNSFPEDHPLFGGFLSAGAEAIVQGLTGHDVVVVLGGPLSVYHTEAVGPHVPGGTKVFLLADNPAFVTWAPVGTATVTEMKSAIAELIALSAPAKREPPPPRKAPPPLDGSIFSDAYLMQQIAKLRPKGSVIVDEAPSSRFGKNDYLPILEPDTFYAGASGGLGFGLPAAVGLSLGRPDVRTIGIIGDGSVMYASQGLWTAAQLQLPVTFVIVNNGRYEALIGFGRHFGLQRTVGTVLQGLDFHGLAKAHGLKGVQVTKAAELDAALAEAFADKGPNLVEVIVD